MCVLLTLAGIASGCIGPSGDGSDGEAQFIGSGEDGFAADADADTYAGPAPLTVRFSARSTNANGPVRYEWNFDDGSGSGEQNPTHTFHKHGWYLVTMDALDGAGGSHRINLQLHAWRPRDWAQFQETHDVRIVQRAIRELERKRARDAAGKVPAAKTGRAVDPTPQN